MKTPFTQAAQDAVTAAKDGSAVIVDVRRTDEWTAGHAKGAIHWELARLEKGELPDIPKDAKVFVHCAAGGRAAQAKEILGANGWTSVANMGGLSDWQSAGGEVES